MEYLQRMPVEKMNTIKIKLKETIAEDMKYGK
jgi:hypothetical protein